jgi:hypothetical protein
MRRARRRFFSGSRRRGTWWIRILGYGVHFHDHRTWPPRFEEREGLDRKLRLRIGAWCFSFLSPSQTPFVPSEGFIDVQALRGLESR